MVQKSKYNKKGYQKARENGFRSGLEEKVAKQIREANHKLRYETVKIKWIDFAIRSYTPDFVLDNGIIIEVKGFWSVADRKKHVQVKEQHPSLDIRLVFENSKNILGMNLITHQTGPEGQQVKKIYITEALDIKKEFY